MKVDDALLALLKEHGFNVTNTGNTWVLVSVRPYDMLVHEADRLLKLVPEACINARYYPNEGVASLLLMVRL